MKPTTPTQRMRRERQGLALLSVVALLTLFAVIGTAFMFTIRMEEQAAVNYSRQARIGEVAGVGSAVADAALGKAHLGPDGKPLSGDEYDYIDSEKDCWNFGFSGQLDLGMQFTARSCLPFIDTRHPDASLTYYRIGIDEDPPGDLNGDGAPGFAGVDDDGDGYADLDDPDVLASMARAEMDPGYDYYPAYDDDEDGLMDEDGTDGYMPPGEGIDNDGDATGIEDESGKLNVNVAGNTSDLLTGGHRHNQGAGGHEIDPTMYFLSRGLSPVLSQSLTRALVNYRHGQTTTGANYPGAPGDDNYNNNTEIIQVPTGEETVGGDDIDNDGDGLIDEADESIYISEPRLRIDGTTLMYGDGIDNDADGEIDEVDEGIDEPGEFNYRYPVGDDNPIDTLEEMRLVIQQVQSDPEEARDIYEQLKPFLTAYSHAPAVGPAYQSRGVFSINQLNNYTPEEYRITIYDLMALVQVDNDGDWTLEDDFNGNGRPDADWDGSGETGAEAADGFDNDGDGLVDLDDDGDFNQDGFTQYDPEYHVNEDPIGDADGTVDPDGLYAPGVARESELADILWPPGVGISGDDDEDGQADFDDEQVEIAIRITGDTHRLNDEVDNDWNNLLWANDGIDNDFDGVVDYPNDPDEGIDSELETGDYLPNDLTAIPDPIFNYSDYTAYSSLEKYYPAFDDDEDGRMDEDPPEFDLLARLKDTLDQPTLYGVGTTDAQIDEVFELQHQRFNPRETGEAVSKFDQDRLPDKDLAAEEEYFKFKQSARGTEGVYINEVMVRPLISLQAEYAGFNIINGQVSIEPAPVNPDTEFEIQPQPGRIGRYYVVTNHPDPDNDPLTNDAVEEEAYWEYIDVQIPYGLYEVYLYQDVLPENNSIRSQVELLILAYDEMGNLVSIFNDDDGDNFDLNNYAPLTFPDPEGGRPQDERILLGINGDVRSVRIQLRVDEAADGVFSFDRIDFYSPDLNFIEITNMAPQPVDLSDHSLYTSYRYRNPTTGSEIFRENEVDLDDFNYSDGSLNPIPPYNPEVGVAQENVLLLCRSLTTLVGAYTDQSGAGAFEIPPDINIGEYANVEIFSASSNHPDHPEINCYEALVNESLFAGYVELRDPEGNYVDSLDFDFKAPFTQKIRGYLPDQRGDPVETGFKGSEAFLPEGVLRRFRLWDADLVMALNYEGDPIDVFGVEEYYDIYWESNPEFPGKIAFKYGRPADLESNSDVREEAIYSIAFCYNLSTRLKHLPFVDGQYMVDCHVNAAPWIGEATVGWNYLSVSGLPYYGSFSTQLDKAQNWTYVYDGDYWGTTVVEETGPTDPPEEDTYLVFQIFRPGDPILTDVPLWESIRIESIDLVDRGTQLPSDVLELRAGSPGVYDYRPWIADYAVNNHRMATPGEVYQPALLGTDYILPPEKIAEVASRITTHYNQTVTGLINVNTAPASVLAALPWLPPRFFDTAISLDRRRSLHQTIAQRLVEGRREFDPAAGEVPREVPDYDDDGDGFVDEGPYREIGDIMRVLRDPFLAADIENILVSYEPSFRWDLREQLEAFARVSGLISVRSNVFTVRSQGRIVEKLDERDTVTAERFVLETIER